MYFGNLKVNLFRQFEERIAKSSASTGRISKLYERIDELKEEEGQLLKMIPNDSIVIVKNDNFTKLKSVDISEETEMEDDNLIDEKEYEKLKDDDDNLIDDDTLINDKESLASSVLKRETFGHDVLSNITDDYSNFDFSSRIDEWLECEKFMEWRQYRNYFITKGLQEQISFELTCFDVITLCDGNFRIPKCLWNELFEYQREGVEWMLKLWEEGNGGVLGDEMGLGKTVQVISCLAALQISGKLDEPSLILAPSTLLRQWIRESNTWWPPLRTVLLHSSSSAFNETRNLKRFLSTFYPKTHLFVTSYGTTSSSSLKTILLSQKWNVVVLDEGHKIRNPDAQITLICKQLQSTRRFVLSGTPIQNNLIELWSLFDFVRPGLLGSLPLFKSELALPINIGGYTNASLFQVQTSYKCACTLRDIIKPFLLRRLKRLVLMNNGNLPEKREDIVFCRITPYQRRLYETFISSDEADAIIERKSNLLAGIDVLRKICNHPDLLFYKKYAEYDESSSSSSDDDDEGIGNSKATSSSFDLMKTFHNLKGPTDPMEKSGKLKVLDKILNLWSHQGHKVLIFCQTRQMLNLIEEFLKTRYFYMRMDGTTPIKQRLKMVDKFNSPKSDIFIFLLTTRVGGLGINLTGADRVIIYDPDWNPSTDLQARERVYRLGQTRPVSILRLITAGTIEEKIYHRQIFKQFLTQRILEDPKQTRFFKAADLHDLFELGRDEEEGTTETADIFDGLEEEIGKKMSGGGFKKKSNFKKKLPVVTDADYENNNNEYNNNEDENIEEEDEEEYKNCDKRTKISNENENLKDSIDPVLNDLLDMVGVHSTLPITGITETIRPEYLLIQKEAEKIAQGALEALEKSRIQNGNQNIKKLTETGHFNQFKPTWTGKFGINKKFGGAIIDDVETANQLTAQDILVAINQRKNNNIIEKSCTIKLALDMVDYFNRVGGRGGVQSDRLAHAFKAQVQGSESALVFRCLLKKVAFFDKKTRIWKLDPNFSI